MNFEGIIIGIGAFLIIEILHPVLSKPNIILEREFGLYSLLGDFFIVLSLFIESVIIAALIGVLGFHCCGVYMNFLNRKKELKRDGIPKI